MTMATIDAKTARGAAAQIVRALRSEARKTGSTAEEAEAAVFVREDDGMFDIWWEVFSPYEWSIVASGGGNIWDEELGLPLHTGEATLRFPDQPGRWWKEPVNGICLRIYSYS